MGGRGVEEVRAVEPAACADLRGASASLGGKRWELDSQGGMWTLVGSPTAPVAGGSDPEGWCRSPLRIVLMLTT